MHMEARKYVWEGAIPLQIHLHESEVTTLPPPPPALILAPRIGYLPMLVGLIKPYFGSSLPPGVDTIWFEYKGLPLKWYTPTGVLFDLLCAEPERPWNLTVHFRGYPVHVLIPCEGEDSVKWSFINSLKEAAYIINGNCKNVMNMSQSDQVELWRSVMNGNLEAYLRVSSKLKLVTVEDDYTVKLNSSSKSQQGTGETDFAGQVKTGRIPVRLYVWSVSEDFDDLEDAPDIDCWDNISFINRPVEVRTEEGCPTIQKEFMIVISLVRKNPDTFVSWFRKGKCFTLHDAIKTLLPEYFTDKPLFSDESPKLEDEEMNLSSEDAGSNKNTEVEEILYEHVTRNAEIKLVRIQGIEPKLEIPFSWVVNNLMNPDYFLYMCICVRVPEVNTV